MTSTLVRSRFQLSIKYRVFDARTGLGQERPWLSGLYFGFRMVEAPLTLDYLREQQYRVAFLVAMAIIVGLAAFGERLAKLREEEPGFAALRIEAQYARAGAIEGVVVHDPDHFEVVLSAAYPQILFWFAMPFTSPSRK